MKNRFLLFIAIFFSLNVLAQSSRHIVEVGGSGGISPGIVASSFNLDLAIFTKDGKDKLKQRSVRYNGLINVGYTFLASKRFGVGLRLSYQQMRIPVSKSVSFTWDNDDDYYYSSNELRRESPAFNAVTALFVMKFTPKKSILPFGLEHTLGIGPRFYSMANRPYYGSYTDTSGNYNEGIIPQEVNRDLENQRYKGVELLYGMELNFPVGIGKFIALGFDFHGSILLKSSYQSINEPEYDYSDPDEKIESLFYNQNYTDELSSRTVFSILNLRVGYKITF